MITKVRQLTRMNVNALNEVKLGRNVGATYAEFDGSPVQALMAVESAMVVVAQTKGIGTTYNSLRAVQRKLNAAIPRYRCEDTATALTPYVDVTR